MIRILKSTLVPSILAVKGAAECARMSAEFDADPVAYRSGIKVFDFDSKIYGAENVKVELTRCQHGKCCFCESKYKHIDYGDVEHFRPKKAYLQRAGENLIRPGYFWLAYDWDNLLVSCTLCNQRHKGNLFPLADPANRSNPTNRDVSIESALFINPANEDPTQYIGFRGAIIFSKNDNERGEKTIKSLGLDRKDLEERRAERLEMLTALFRTIKTADEPSRVGDLQLQSDAASARRILNNSLLDSAEYAGMARSAFL